MILFFSQTTKLVFQKCVTGFRVKLTKFPYAEAEIFGFNFGYTAGDGFKKCIMNKYILRLGKNNKNNTFNSLPTTTASSLNTFQKALSCPGSRKIFFLDAAWHTDLPRFQGAESDHVQIESSSCWGPFLKSPDNFSGPKNHL